MMISPLKSARTSLLRQVTLRLRWRREKPASKQPSATSKTELPAQGGPVSTETATVSGEDSNWAAEMEELRTKVKEQKMLLEEENKKPKGASRRMSRETHKLRKEVNHNKESILNNIAKVIDDRRISTPSCCPTASTPETLRSVS